MSKIKAITKIYLMRDSHGNEAYAVVGDDDTDRVQVYGLLDKSGQRIEFEDEAWHLPSFCRENEINLIIVSREDDFDSLWGQNEQK